MEKLCLMNISINRLSVHCLDTIRGRTCIASYLSMLDLNSVPKNEILCYCLVAKCSWDFGCLTVWCTNLASISFTYLPFSVVRMSNLNLSHYPQFTAGSLPPSRRRSLFILATSMILFSSKAYNILSLVHVAKAALTDKMVSIYHGLYVIRFPLEAIYQAYNFTDKEELHAYVPN